jgi:hypothetical protein
MLVVDAHHPSREAVEQRIERDGQEIDPVAHIRILESQKGGPFAFG